jgi:hypothetical protein
MKRFPVLAISSLSNNTINERWRQQVDDDNVLAGMLALGVAIIGESNRTAAEELFVIDSNIDVSEYRRYRHVREGDIESRSSTALTDDEIGLWIKSDLFGYYSLYVFNTLSFVDGVMEMGSLFFVNVQDYIYGVPFNTFGIFPTVFRVPTTVAEDSPDLDDVEEEWADDENILEPLKKDY